MRYLVIYVIYDVMELINKYKSKHLGEVNKKRDISDDVIKKIALSFPTMLLTVVFFSIIAHYSIVFGFFVLIVMFVLWLFFLFKYLRIDSANIITQKESLLFHLYTLLENLQEYIIDKKQKI